ncbi:vacuolar ATPase assembly integral membrane protein VMA21 isoform X2 [Dryobates pubescens]|uniref:vacuolar ATPase assembly integral membrane protein VMA21 isoform X2 n=1 Tax=Dryobates pubescens TaxID=118200 RepID=UPI0023BA01EF|nr:vacuolar ATPase assembly integral membrane protein VMA21 isoform X2 [Dryobates pubescens]
MERYGQPPLSAVPVAEFRHQQMLPSDAPTQFLKSSWLLFGTSSCPVSGTLGMSDRDSYFYAAIVAVVTVHVVLALFVYVAWNEGSRQWREGKQD